ncbi:MAG: hypothetical protein JRI68_02605 [Deltaproteobacteria bacterium]|nr:hypothetical protein [Deltaproteobacteria bacterium]
MPRSFVILGAGRFGKLAVTRLAAAHPAAPITVVDAQPGDLPETAGDNLQAIAAEGIDYLTEQLHAGELPASAIIVPAIPVHVAFEWIFRELSREGTVERAPVPKDLGLPNETGGPTGDRYVSLADFICPDDCPEPKKACPITQASRGVPMVRRIAELSSPTRPVLAIRSEQLAPGVGGYPVARLVELRQAVTSLTGIVLVGTACSCHGVISALALTATAAQT